MHSSNKPTLSERNEQINQIGKELKSIESRIMKEEQKNNRNLSLLSKLSYMVVAIFSLILVVSGVFSFQNNFDLRSSQAGTQYSCNKDEVLTGTNCIIPAKTNPNYTLTCPIGYTQMEAICVQLEQLPPKIGCATVNSPTSSCIQTDCQNSFFVAAEAGFCKIDPTKLNQIVLGNFADYDGRTCSKDGFNLKKVTLVNSGSIIYCSNIFNALDKAAFRVVDTSNKQINKVANFENQTTNSNVCATGYTPTENGTKCSRPATTSSCDQGGEFMKDGKCEPCPAGKFCPITNGNTSQVAVCAAGGTLSDDKTRCVANNKIMYTKYIDGCTSEYIKLDKTCAIKEARTHSLGCTYFYASGNENIKAVDSGTLAGMPACSTGGRQDFADTAIYKVADFNCDGANTYWYNYNVAFDPLVCGTDITVGKLQFRWTAQTFTKITPLQKIADGQVKECPTGWIDMGGDSCYQAPIIRQVTTPLDCPINTFSATGSTTCTVCPSNTTSPVSSMTAASCRPIVCTNGTVNPPLCNVCPAGKMLTNNQCVDIPKPVVEVIPVKNDDRVLRTIELPKPKIVEPCVSQSGYYTDNNGFCQICPIGHYCPGKTNSPIVCPIGTTTTYQGAKSEIECKSAMITTTTITRTVRTGGLSVIAISIVMIAMFGYGYYYLFMVESKGKFSKTWFKVK